MQLKEIYRPIEGELSEVEKLLRQSLASSRHKSILEISDYLLDAQGKKLRPALVILCCKATAKYQTPALRQQLIRIATAIELIHMASLIHDDVIDQANIRHNKLTINARCGQDVSIALGDYLYSIAFNLISICGNSDILECISSATKSMCEGELVQVCERDNLNLLKERYIIIAEKKTASLFVASCQTPAILANRNRFIQNSLKDYGLNFGIAFQIVDDCLDLIGKAEDLGKSPGTDFKMGELTLPVLNLISQSKDKNRIISLISQQDNLDAFKELRQRFINSPAALRTKRDILFYISKAKQKLSRLDRSESRESLLNLADYIAERLRL